jgi:hypothetical protein
MAVERVFVEHSMRDVEWGGRRPRPSRWRGVPVCLSCEYSPNEVKLAIAGDRRGQAGQHM